VSVPEFLLEVLVCPEDKGSLYYFETEGFFYNPRLRRKYPVRDGIVVMLVEEAETVDETEHERLMAAIGQGKARLTAAGRSGAGSAEGR
jgi:uncharacterized protein YbaR (Trm112 family)